MDHGLIIHQHIVIMTSSEYSILYLSHLVVTLLDNAGETNEDDMTPAPDRVAIVWPLGLAVTLTFSTVIIQALALMPIIYFVRYELRLGRAGVRFWKDVGIVTGATLVLSCGSSRAGCWQP